MTRLSSRAVACAVAALLAGCGGSAPPSHGPDRVSLPVTDGVKKAPRREEPTRLSPPPSGAAKQSPFPAVARARLDNGVTLDVVTSKALPIVQVRVLVRAGSSSSGVPGVGELTGEMVKDGGTRAMASAEVLRRIETMGANLSVSVDPDSTVLALAVTTDQLPEAMNLLGQIVREPRFDEAELRKTKARATDAAEDAARSSGAWTGSWLVFRELYSASHPYGTYGLLPSAIAKIDGARIRDFHRRFWVAKNTSVILAGDVDAATAKSLATSAFGGMSAAEPPTVDRPAPKPIARKVIVAHRPKSVQSDVFVATLAPERKSPAWASLRVANQILGGGVASRLFADVREQRSLAYRTSAQIFEMAHGPQPLVLYAGTQTPKTAQAVTGLLENLARMTSAPPTAAETETARRYLSDVFAVRMETIGAIADMVVAQRALGLEDVVPGPGQPVVSYWDDYRQKLRATTPEAAAEAARTLYAPERVFVVVAGDADVVGPELATFGEVTVVDPEKEFKVLRTLPKVNR